jgi:hypothetical protein
MVRLKPREHLHPPLPIQHLKHRLPLQRRTWSSPRSRNSWRRAKTSMERMANVACGTCHDVSSGVPG